MEVAQIRGDTVQLIYHPSDEVAEVGEQFALVEFGAHGAGLVIQVIANESLQYAGLDQELIQRILEQHSGQVITPLDGETGLGSIRGIKVAIAKIRKQLGPDGSWRRWGGWIPSRNAAIKPIGLEALLTHVVHEAAFPLEGIARFAGQSVALDGERLNMVNVIAGVKGQGKSHLAKLLLLAVAARGVPCLVFDVNGEYDGLPGVQALRWGDNYRPCLGDLGPEVLSTIVQSVYPLNPGSPSESAFDAGLPRIFGTRRRKGQPITVDSLKTNWSHNDMIQGAIDARIERVKQLGLFWDPLRDFEEPETFEELYERACAGQPLVFDLREVPAGLQRALAKALTRLVEQRCRAEAVAGGRFPFIFYEEAHVYVSEGALLNAITRGRHFGIGTVFVTNTPQKLPDMVFRQLDNLFLLGLTHEDDIKAVSKNAFADQETIESFATRMPEHHALFMGNLTDRYPLVVEVAPLPEHVPSTGRTRSTWDRFQRLDGPRPS